MLKGYPDFEGRLLISFTRGRFPRREWPHYPRGTSEPTTFFAGMDISSGVASPVRRRSIVSFVPGEATVTG